MTSADTATRGHRLPWWRSVRARITLAVVIFTSLAMSGAGLAAYLVEERRTERRILNSVTDELDEFKTLRTEGIDPETRRPFGTVRRLTFVTLLRNAPDEREVLIAWFNDRPQFQNSVNGIGEELLADDAFVDRVRGLIDSGGGTIEMETVLGSTLTAVQPIEDDTGDGAFIVAYLTGQEREEFFQTVRTYVAVCVIALLAVTVGAWSVSGRLLSPVRQLRATAQEITDTDLSRRIPVEGDDDISDLVRTVNAMLERLDRAFATQRTFLDDAGHELRTPVTVLRGHLELLDPYDARDVTATRELLLDEIDRMSRMVDDLILLAKADRPDFVHPAPTDIAVLVDQVIDKARATAERAWQVDERAVGTHWLDAQRVTQALLQLASNAVRHTDDGDVVALGSRLDDGFLRLWVRDGGPGVAEAEREKIFERFVQGKDRTAEEGSGLGLSIVRAIAEAHGGSAYVESAAGQGATFVLTLPRTGGHLTGEVQRRFIDAGRVHAGRVQEGHVQEGQS